MPSPPVAIGKLDEMASSFTQNSKAGKPNSAGFISVHLWKLHLLHM